MAQTNSIQVFQSPQFGQVRTAGTSDNPLFCLADVCKALELRQGDVRQRLTDGVVSTQPILDSLGREQVANFVNEDGLYDVILDSRKPEAKQFRKWVTSEVLPSIRKTGGYIASSAEDTPEEIMARAFIIAQDTIKRKDERIALQQQTIDRQQGVISIQAEQLEGQTKELESHKPILEIYDRLVNTEGLLRARDVAALFGMSPVTFNRTLAGLGVQYKQGGTWFLYAHLRDKGYTVHKVQQIPNTDKEELRMLWTAQGRLFCYELFKKHNLLPKSMLN
jgi:prophage antirepressor-like protein